MSSFATFAKSLATEIVAECKNDKCLLCEHLLPRRDLHVRYKLYLTNGKALFNDSFRALCETCWLDIKGRLDTYCKSCMIPFVLTDHVPPLVQQALLLTSLVQRSPHDEEHCLACTDPDFGEANRIPRIPTADTKMESPNTPPPQTTTAVTPLRKKLLFKEEEVSAKPPRSIERKVAAYSQARQTQPLCPMCNGDMNIDEAIYAIARGDVEREIMLKNATHFVLRCFQCHGLWGGTVCTGCRYPLSIVSFRCAPLERAGRNLGLCRLRVGNTASCGC